MTGGGGAGGPAEPFGGIDRVVEVAMLVKGIVIPPRWMLGEGRTGRVAIETAHRLAAAGEIAAMTALAAGQVGVGG
jgi:hypothetical protein